MGQSLKLKSYYLPIIWICIGIAYGNVYQNTFLYDDEFFIIKNSFLRSWDFFFKIFQGTSTTGSGGVDSFYRPLQQVAYLFIYQLFGLSTFAFHFLNIFIHLLNASLMYFLGLRLNFNRTACFVATIIWGLHPIHTEAVTYMSATADTLYTFFCLLGLYILVPNFNGFALVTFIYGLALLSKEAAVVFLPLCLICIFILDYNRWSFRTYFKAWPIMTLTIVYLVLRKTILNFNDTFNFYKEANIYSENILYRVYTFLATLPDYLLLLFWPSFLSIDREFPVYISITSWPVMCGLMIILLALCKSALDIRQNYFIFVFGIFWFFGSYFPHSGVLIPMNSLFLEHWLYLPTVGLFLGLAQTAYEKLSPFRFRYARPILIVLLMIVCSLEVARTRDQNKVWQDPISLYSHILEHSKVGSSRAHNNLAMALDQSGRHDEAILEYELAIKISDVYPQTHHNLALVLIKKNKLEDAISHLKRAIEINPNFYNSYDYLAQIHDFRGEKLLAAKYRSEYLRIQNQFSP